MAASSNSTGGLGERPGDVVDERGRIVARHRGQHRFTVGQRRGLGIANPAANGAPLYVLDKDAHSNRILVGPHESLRTTHVRIRGARLRRPGARVDRVKLRYRSQPVPARVNGELDAGHHRSLTIDLAAPVYGAAPGQLACLMDGELVVGWGTITR